MDQARRARYADGLARADGRLQPAEAWLPSARETLKDRLAAYKAFQEAAEAVADLAAMAVADSGAVPKDDDRNLDLAAELGVVGAEALPR